MSIYTEHFKTVFGTKQNIQSLRNKVLELAIQGKLLYKSDEDYSDNSVVVNDDVSYQIPNHWREFSLRAIIDYRNGYAFSSKNMSKDGEGIPVIKSNTIGSKKVIFNAKTDYVKETDEKMNKHFVYKDTLLMVMSSQSPNVTPLGVTAVYKFDAPALLNQRVLSFKSSSIISDLLCYFINSELFHGPLSRRAKGSAQANLKLEHILSMNIPLPSFSEQERIVEKIESLMSEIDNLEYYLERKEKLEEALPNAVVSAISNCQNEEELKVQLGFVIEHFTEVFQTAESLQELRDVILQLGIQGKLVPQNPMDAPASELLKNIQAEKELLIKEKIIKKDKALPEIEKDEVPFEIPVSWEWVRLGKIALINPRNQIDDNLNVGFIPMTLIKEGYGNDYSYEIKEWKAIKKGYTHFKQGDIVVAKITPCFENRKSAILYELSHGFGAGTTELHVIRVEEKFVSKEYLLYLFKTAWFISLGVDTFQGTAGQQRIGTDFITQSSIPLPPLAEQKRIVDKVESLFAIIDKLEKEMQRNQRIVKAMATI